MAKYIFNCKECNDEKTLNISISSYEEKSKNILCDKCGLKMTRVFKSFGFKVKKSSQEMVEQMNKEKKEIIEKFNSGDIKTITDICGDE